MMGEQLSETDPYRIYDARWNALSATDSNIQARAAGILATATEAEAPDISIDFNALSLPEMEALRATAVEQADYVTLQTLQQAAARMDGWDDTDPSYAHFVEQCSADIKSIMTYYG